MKTEQERIEAMANFIHIAIHEKCLLNNGGHCIDCDYNTDEECQNRLVAKELFEAGYGDVSEYKAEIERLKADFESLKEDYEFVRECDNKHCLEIKETIKQAQIDVLNKVKKCDVCGAVPLKYIDELIKEVENDK